MQKNRIWLAFVFLTLVFAALSWDRVRTRHWLAQLRTLQGATISNADINLQNHDTGVQFTTTTGENGLYRFNNIPVGHYDVTANAAGFNRATLKNVNLELNRIVTANMVVQVGAVTTTVEVSEAGAAIDTTTAQIQSSFDSRQIVNMPIIENSGTEAVRRPESFAPKLRSGLEWRCGTRNRTVHWRAAPDEQQFHHRRRGQQQ